MAEKCTEELKLRLPENLLLQLSRLAHADDRRAKGRRAGIAGTASRGGRRPERT